ncbi:hypothetical protein Tco_1275327 [Tanacetum coccineum]
MSPKRRLFLTTGDSVLPGMHSVISMQIRSNVRFSALFPDTEEKSSVYPYNFPSMILQKIIWISHGGLMLLENQSNLCFHKFDTQSTTTSLSVENGSLIEGENTMADVNVNVPAEQAPAMAPPTRTDDQILPRGSWVPVGKSNCYLDVEKSQSNLIYKIAFWDTVRYVKNTRSYNCQLDEQWFDLTKDTLRDALQITPVDNNNPFSSPPTPNALINFVNELGYPNVVRTLSTVVTNDMFQPWRALTTIINLCLTGKTSGFERPRAPGKKKANLIMILSVRFTKLIIHHLQSKHKFHPRPGSPLHLPNEELVLGYLKRTILQCVAKHKRYLAGEEVSDPGSPAPKPAKATKPKATKQSNPLASKAAPVTKPAVAKAPKPTASQPPKPKPAITEPSKKDQCKKRKLVKESSEAPSLAKRPKAGKVIKKRKPKSSLQLIDELVNEGVPEKEPVYADEEADTKRAIEKSLKEVHDAHRGPLPLVVIRELDSGKFQPLPDVQGKGHDESSSLYVELGLTDNVTESDEEVPGTDVGDQDEG